MRQRIRSRGGTTSHIRCHLLRLYSHPIRRNEERFGAKNHRRHQRGDGHHTGVERLHTHAQSGPGPAVGWQDVRQVDNRCARNGGRAVTPRPDGTSLSSAILVEQRQECWHQIRSHLLLLRKGFSSKGEQASLMRVWVHDGRSVEGDAALSFCRAVERCVTSQALHSLVLSLPS